MAETEIKIINGRKICDATARDQIKNKVEKVEGKGLSTVDFTTEKDNKLNGIAEGANKYTHPKNHPATVITEDETHRFVTDAEKAKWDAKSDFDGNYGSLNNAPVLSFNETGELVVTIGNVSKTFVPKVESA